MADYRIVCTDQRPVTEPATHAHIVAVGTGTDAGWTQGWTLAEVLLAMRQWHRFFTVSPSTGRTAIVQAVACQVCGHTIIRSTPDAVVDNNLDSLNRCQWR